MRFSEAIGPVQFASTGGQLDFVQGAWLSKGGKSFICLESTFVDKNGERKSKIVPQLYPGSFVTTPRTRFTGWSPNTARSSQGQSIRTRVKNPIPIAHPTRDELMFEAKKMGYLR